MKKMAKKRIKKMWTDKQVVSFFTPVTPKEDAFDRDAQGVELEIELNDAFYYEPVNSFVKNTLNWVVTNDGSLRGTAYEYITEPKKAKEHVKDLSAFDYKLLNSTKAPNLDAVLNKSHRTSTHVHLNFSKDSVEEQLKFIALYYLFEQVFFALAEQDRSSNTYCVSSNVIPYRISDNIEAKKNFAVGITDKEANKYASLNFSRLCDLGTIESRLMHGYKGCAKLANWLYVLEELKVSARKNFSSLEDINKKYLDIPCKDFLSLVFPEMHGVISEALEMKGAALKTTLADGYRSAFSILRHSDLVSEGVKVYAAAKERHDKIQKAEAEARAKLFKEAANVAPIGFGAAVGIRGHNIDWVVVDDF